MGLNPGRCFVAPQQAELDITLKQSLTKQQPLEIKNTTLRERHSGTPPALQQGLLHSGVPVSGADLQGGGPVWGGPVWGGPVRSGASVIATVTAPYIHFEDHTTTEV